MPRLPSILIAGLVACGGTTARPAEDAPTPAPGPRPSRVAVATLVDSTGSQIGVATLSDSAGAALLGLSVSGLSPGTHGLHIHAQGNCVPPAFESAGGHFNPDGRKHGLRNPEGPHAGDLPNLHVPSNGSVDTSYAVSGDLVRAGPRFILQPGGTSIVVHAAADDEVTDPSGSSGARIACGVFRAD